jgi:hypothetical protein
MSVEQFGEKTSSLNTQGSKPQEYKVYGIWVVDKFEPKTYECDPNHLGRVLI